MDKNAQKQYRLPKEFAEKWLTALRSGEYKQGKETLYNIRTDCYCVLGIGAKVVGYDNDEIEGWGTIQPAMKLVPAELHEIKDNKGELELWNALTSMNDGGSTFPEIADWIESNVELY